MAVAKKLKEKKELKKETKPRMRVEYRDRLVSQDDGEGNWLISYADLMTLLVGFFIILSAFSTPDPAKMERLKKATSKSMEVEYVNPFEELSSSLHNVLKDYKLDNDVDIIETDDGVTIISKGTLFFKSGSTKMNPEAKSLMTKVSGILVKRAKGFRVLVEGHTDDAPIVSTRFPSNWELSSARAGTVVRLLEDKGFEHNNLRPLGLADTMPIVPNRDKTGRAIPENRAQNRRIVIHIKKQLPRRVSGSKKKKSKSGPVGTKTRKS